MEGGRKEGEEFFRLGVLSGKRGGLCKKRVVDRGEFASPISSLFHRERWYCGKRVAEETLLSVRVSLAPLPPPSSLRGSRG